MARTMKEIEATAYDLKRIREGFKMSQTQFAEFLHTTQATISRWETERAVPPIVKLYLNLYQKGQKAPTNRKQKKAKRVAVRAKLGALTPAEKEAETAYEDTRHAARMGHVVDTLGED